MYTCSTELSKMQKANKCCTMHYGFSVSIILMLFYSGYGISGAIRTCQSATCYYERT